MQGLVRRAWDPKPPAQTVSAESHPQWRTYGDAALVQQLVTSEMRQSTPLAHIGPSKVNLSELPHIMEYLLHLRAFPQPSCLQALGLHWTSKVRAASMSFERNWISSAWQDPDQ